MHAHLSAGAEDDASLVKHIGQSFRFSAVEVSTFTFYEQNSQIISLITGLYALLTM